MAKKDEKLTYIPSADKNNSAILGTLVGPCADIINPTRNGRGYSEDLWEKVFDSDIVKEHFQNGGLFGELGHPADRSETEPEKIAICMKEPPKKGKDGLLMGRWDILDTPNGRILKTLVDYGYKVGISSRGTGDVFSDDNGNEQVDSDSYDFQAFDIVLLPAVKAARLSPVTESVSVNKTLRQALTESLNNSSESDRKIMESTLKELHLEVLSEEKEENDSTKGPMSFEQARAYIKDKFDKDLDEKTYNLIIGLSGKNESIPVTVGDKEVSLVDVKKESKDLHEAVDNGSAELIKSLQEAVKSKAESDAKLLELQNKLAVSDAKVGKIEEELSRYKSTTIRLSTLAKESKKLKNTIITLEEQVDLKTRIIQTQKARLEKLNESIKGSTNILQESVSKKDLEISKLNESMTSLRAQNSEASNKITTLNERLEEFKKVSEADKQELTGKLTKTEKLLESYKKIAHDTVRRYIESKARMLGVQPNEIKNRLGESYTIDDIDKVCEDLKSYELNISKLPFSVDRKVKVRVTESKNDLLRPDSGMDDEIDDSLITLAKL